MFAFHASRSGMFSISTTKQTIKRILLFQLISLPSLQVVSLEQEYFACGKQFFVQENMRINVTMLPSPSM